MEWPSMPALLRPALHASCKSSAVGGMRVSQQSVTLTPALPVTRQPTCTPSWRSTSFAYCATWRDGQQPCARDRQVPHHSGIGKHVWVVDDNQVALRQVQGQDLPAVLREGPVGSGCVCSRMDGSAVALAVPGAEQLCLHCLGPK